jgi:hypothetical protein
MLKKHSILLGITIAAVLLFVATLHYPGGSQHSTTSIGYDWRNNYLCNLFSLNAVNGAPNTSRPWAVAGMLFLSASFGWFFFDFSKKIPATGPAKVVKYCGVGAMVFAFLVITPYHDPMVTIAGTLALISMFYVTVFIFKSRLHLFKVLSVVCLLVFYCCNYVYYTSSYLDILPVLQKVLFALAIIWVLCLQYLLQRPISNPQKMLQ